MSNGSYERFGKLQAALGKIVFDDRRHLESVCAVLQGLVFDKFEWPKSKDWNQIRFVAKKNPAMAAILANLDLNDTDVSTRQIIAAFPQCFREEAAPGPIPLSCIRAMAVEKGREVFKHSRDRGETFDAERYAQFPHSYGVLDDLNLQYALFVTSAAADQWDELEQRPQFAELKQGDLVVLDYLGLSVVVENNQNSGVHEIAFVSAASVDHTC